MNDAHLPRLQRIFREVFDQSDLKIGADYSTADHPEWDSVATVQIVLAVEQEFSVRLPMEAVAGIKTVGDILRQLPA